MKMRRKNPRMWMMRTLVIETTRKLAQRVRTFWDGGLEEESLYLYGA